MTNERDTWEDGGAYEPYVGRWSRLVAREFLYWLAVSPGSDWLDVGCGTGALTNAILQRAQPATVTGIDPAKGLLAYARDHIRDARAAFKVGGALSLPFADETFDAVVSGLVLNFIPDPRAAVAEMVRVTRPLGIVAAYVWDYAGEMQMMRFFWDAAVELEPPIAEKDEGRRFPICKPEPLSQLFEGAGLRRVETRSIDLPTRFRDFDDYWLPFLRGQGPAPSYVTTLHEEKRIALRERIRSRLPVSPDGSITLLARAWAIRGIK